MHCENCKYCKPLYSGLMAICEKYMEYVYPDLTVCNDGKKKDDEKEDDK